MFISWAFSIQFWLLFKGPHLKLSFLVVDVALAVAFFQLSRGRWFPAPLFFLHLLIIAFHVYALAVAQSPFWMMAFLNRTFDLALLYIIACAVYRIRHTA